MPNRTLWIVTGLTLGLLGLVLYLPVIADLFLYQPLAWEHLLTAMALGAMSVFWFEAIKLSRRQKPSS